LRLGFSIFFVYLCTMLNDFQQKVMEASNDCFRNGDANDVRYIFDEQINAAKEIVCSFLDMTTRRGHVFLVARMQSGKTGTTNAVCNIVNNLQLNGQMMVNKFFFISGMNDCGLKSQTHKRLIEQVTDANVSNTYIGKRSLQKGNRMENMKYFCLKNSDLMGFDGSIDNSIIFIDECHYGSNATNKLTKFLEKNGVSWKNENNLISRNIYIVSVSATPFSEMISDTIDCKKVIVLNTSSGYYGVSDFYDNGQVHESKSGSHDDIADILFALREGYTQMRKDDVCGICFVRCRNFEELKSRNFIKYNFDVYEMDASSTKINYDKLNVRIEELLEINRYNSQFKGIETPYILAKKKPIKGLLVIIKGAFRAGITIDAKYKDYVYCVYDHNTTAAATAQAMLGRMCGYRGENKNLVTQFWVNSRYAEQYSEWESSDFDKDNIPCDGFQKIWIENTADLSKGTPIYASKSCGNFAIELSKEEVEKLYIACKAKRNGRKNAMVLFPQLLAKKGIQCNYDYFHEAAMSGKNNYKNSSQIKRFDSFSNDSLVYGFRASEIAEFKEKTGRDYLTREDYGLRCVSIVLDAEIDKNTDTCIGGNCRLLVYYSEVGAFRMAPNKNSMYQKHKDTNI